MPGVTVTPIQTQSGTGANLTSLLTLTSGSYASGAAVQFVRPQLLLSNLNAAAAAITVKIRNTTDNLTVYRESVAKDAAADTGIRFTLPPFLTTANKTYGIQVLSSNASDTNVSWQIDWLDANLSAATLTADERSAAADALLDRADAVETGKTLRQAMRIMAAVLAGKVSGAGSGTETFKGLDGATTRAVVTTDADANRTNVEYSP